MSVKVLSAFILLFVPTTLAVVQSSPVSLRSIQPNAVLAGAGATIVTLIGSGFNSSQMVTVMDHGSGQLQTLTPVLIDSTAMQVSIPASFLTRAAVLTVTVSPAPGSAFQYLYVYSLSPPAVSGVSPAGAPPGTTLFLRIAGTDLVGATLTFDGSGITAVPATDQQSVTPTTSWVFQLTVAPDALLGTQTMTISTPSGSTTTCGATPCTFTVVPSGVWTDASTMSLPTPNGVIRLLDNRILVAGVALLNNQSVSVAKIFDPVSSQWTDTAAPNTRRWQTAGAVLLPDGRVFLSSSDSVMAEIYDPATATWTYTNRMSAIPSDSPILLPNGQVLVPHLTSGVDLFDPSSGGVQTVSIPSGTMQLLANGKVLILNGTNNKIYDPSTGTSAMVPVLPNWHQLALLFNRCCITRLLPDGRVLIQYGQSTQIHDRIDTSSYAVTYDPQTNTLVPSAATIGGGSASHGTVLLPSGKLLISEVLPLIGGPVLFRSSPSAGLYDPQTDRVFLQTVANPPFTPDILLDDGEAFGISNLNATEFHGVFAGLHSPVREAAPSPIIGSVIQIATASAGPIALDVRGNSFLPNSIVQLGNSRLVTLYLGAKRMIAFVPGPLASALSAGITITNPGPGGGSTAPVPIGFIQALPIPDVESGAIRTGYAIITPDSGSAAPVSTVTYGIVHNAIVQSQAAILPTPLTTATTLPVDYVRTIGRNIGVAIANPNSATALIALALRDPQGTAISSISLSIAAGNQMARFVNELFSTTAIGVAFTGSLSIQSSQPVSIIGLRFSGQEFSTVPISVTNPPTTSQIVFPQVAISGGWATTFGLVNATGNPISGRLDLFDPTGKPLVVNLNDATASTFIYSTPARGTFTFAPRDPSGLSPF